MSIFEDKQRILEDIRDKRTPNRALTKIRELQAKIKASEEVKAMTKYKRVEELYGIMYNFYLEHGNSQDKELLDELKEVLEIAKLVSNNKEKYDVSGIQEAIERMYDDEIEQNNLARRGHIEKEEALRRHMEEDLETLRELVSKASVLDTTINVGGNLNGE